MVPIVDNKGFEVGGVYIPSFQLFRGEYLSLDFLEYDMAIENKVVDVLTNKNKVETVRIYESLAFISHVFHHSFFERLFRSNNVSAFLRKMNFSLDETISTVASIGIGPKDNLYSLGFNERKLLALAVAYKETKNIVINCSGLDYVGISKLRLNIRSQLADGCVIELNYPNTRGREYLFDESHYSARKVIKIDNT